MSKSDDYYIIRDTIFGSKEIPAYQTNDFGAIPQIVYKYLDLSKPHNKKSLIEDYLWFSDPNTFNDPFDCKMSFAYHLLAENEDVCRKYYEFHVNLNEPNLSIEQKKFVIDKNVDRIISNKSNIDFFQNMEKQMALSLSEGIKEFGILCTCMINDNILLWSHYASSHTGICLGLKTDRLLETYYNKGDMGAGEIKYDKFPQIMPLYSNDNKEIVDTFQPFFLTKAAYWNYELEYRFIDYPCSERKKYIGDILDSIYMGCNISKEDEIFIKDFCKKDNRKITLYKAEKTFFKYEVEYNKVAY